VAFRSIPFHRLPSRQSAPLSARVRRRRAVAGAGLLVSALVQAAACTLTQDEFYPPLVEARPLVPPDAGAPAAEACAPGESCCAALPCPPGQICTAGACVTPVAADAGACVGTDCSEPPPLVPLAPSCDDGVSNGDETGADCGGSCPNSCSAGSGCSTDADCGPGLFCAPGASECASISCSDEVQNGEEAAVDCGGSLCPGCPDGSACTGNPDCASGVCGATSTCSPPACNDRVQNGSESAVDCGGVCPLDCADGAACLVNADCQSQVCDDTGCAAGLALCCQEPSCDDGVRNGGEPVVDCGNAACELCPLGNPCFAGAQCASGTCTGGACANPPTCTDNALNGNESAVDCGGDTCQRCQDRQTCNAAADCVNNNCDAFGICISCGDNVRDGTETGVDCGGADPFCRRCNAGEGCFANTDCISQFCFNGLCG
jgi:hypothetical protein